MQLFPASCIPSVVCESGSQLITVKNNLLRNVTRPQNFRVFVKMVMKLEVPSFNPIVPARNQASHLIYCTLLQH